jgi:hypothetical protein
MDKEVWTDILFGLVALTIPLAFYIAYLDLRTWRKQRSLLMLARAMTRLGWALTVGAVGVRAVRQYPPIEHGPGWLYGVFIAGLVLSCFGFFGVARRFHLEERGDRPDNEGKG